MRSFAVFADHLNFTRAAAELHISQPALHTKVQKLATTVGTPLYLRDGRRLELTTAGQSMAEFARGIGVELDRFLGQFGGEAAPQVLAAGQGAHRYVIAEAVRSLLARRVRLRLLTTNQEETVAAVRSGEADVGVTVLGPRPIGLDAVSLATYPQVAMLPSGHALARRRRLSIADLAGVDIVVPPPGKPQRTSLEEAAERAGFALTIAGEAEGWSQMLHFVRLGVGVCVANGCVDPGPGLVRRPLSDLAPVTYSAVVRTSDRHDLQLAGLVETLRTSVR